MGLQDWAGITRVRCMSALVCQIQPGLLDRTGAAKLDVGRTIAGADMFGKFIILTIAILLIGAFLHKLATRLGLIKPKPPQTAPARQLGTTGFRLPKFNIAML